MLPFLPPTVPFRVNLLVAARLLPTIIKRAPLSDILARATPARKHGGSLSLPPAEIVAAVNQVTANPWRMRGRRCLRQGVLAFHYLARAGHHPVLHFAVAPSTLSTARPRAHCWVSVGDEIVINPPVEAMIEIFRHDTTTPPQDLKVREVIWS